MILSSSWDVPKVACLSLSLALLSVFFYARHFSHIVPMPNENRCRADLDSFDLGEQEETTTTPLYYMDEDNPARPENK